MTIPSGMSPAEFHRERATAERVCGATRGAYHCVAAPHIGRHTWRDAVGRKLGKRRLPIAETLAHRETRWNRATTAIERIDWLRSHAVRWEEIIIAAGETGLYRGVPITGEWVQREKRLLAEHRAELRAIEMASAWGQA
jgi:hypothetical protein